MKATQKEIDRALALLSQTPLRIADATHGMDEALLQTKPDQQSWAVNEILAHLRSCADLWTHSIYAMLAENEPVFSDINERKWAKVTRYAELPFRDSFAVFSLQRESLLHVLRELPFEAWERSARIFGRKHTIFTQTRRLAKHENEHCEQIEALLRRSMR